MRLSLYIHVPFCIRKCRYCDFTSYPYTADAAQKYLTGLKQEIQLYGSLLHQEDVEISTLFFGGGTPTCLSAAEINEVINWVKAHFSLTEACEITVEANPGTISTAGLASLRRAGVNRLSLGVQSFEDGLLKTLGRIHDAAQAVEAVLMARRAGFHNINIDLIYGIPGQSLAAWQNTLQRVLELAPEHISAYGLQLEEGTPLEQAIKQGAIKACPEDVDLAMYREIIDTLTRSGYSHYEISNFAKPGYECVHNLVYWLNGPYLGLGPAAHSYICGERYANENSLADYCQRIGQAKALPAQREALTIEEQMSETVFLGLRLTKGVNLAGFRERFHISLEEAYHSQIKKLTSQGLVMLDGGYLRLTKQGLPVANRVFMEFI
ncbi:MAG: radical SAM family heme chaperone HemW [Pelotomaculum sp.]|jgi:oxygen-independent coproporphyrinogen-3 oxidase